MEDNFDPDKYLAENSDSVTSEDTFDPDQYLSESKEEKLKDPSEQPKIKAAAATAGLGVEALRRGISGAGQTALEKVGVLTPQQMKTISEVPEEYRKSRTFSDLLEQFQELGQQTRQTGFEARKRGVESLKGLAPISGQEIIPELGDITKGPVMELSPEELPQAKKVPSKKASDLQKLLDEKQALETKLGVIQETGIESIERNKEINSLSGRLNKVNTELTKNIPEASRFPTETISPSLKDFEKATNIPGELLEARPDLANKKIQKELGKVLKKEIDFLKTGSIEPEKLANYVRSLQEKTSYLVAPSEADKFKQEIARNVSNYLKNLEGAEGYTKGQAQSQKAIQLEKGMKEFGLGLDTEGNVKITNPKKIENLYKSGNEKEINRLNRYVNQAQEFQLEFNVPLQTDILPANMDRFQTELPFASIKKTVEEAKDLPLVTTAKRTMGAGVGGALGGIPGAIAGLTGSGALPTGTKLQEAASLAKGSGLYKTAAKASKLLGPIGALAAGGMAYKGAEEAGLEGIEQLGVTAGEIINPIPFTDVTGAYVAGKKELPQGLGSAARAAGEAFVKPAKQVMEAPSKIDYSSEELRRMERGESIPSFKAYKGNLKTENPAEIESITRAMQAGTDKASQEYSRVLSQVQNATLSQKEAILFGLNQQPAFRELVRKLKDEQEMEQEITPLMLKGPA
jgi:hypothetical protein